MKKIQTADYELSRPLLVDKISAGGVAEHIIANANERTALVKRFALLDLPKLEAKLNIDPVRGNMYAVTGSITADVTQQCVITLEPVPTHIEEKINVLYAPPHMLEKGAGTPHFDASDEESPEAIVNGIIELGELVAQHLAVALDPYPRKPGVALESISFGPKNGNSDEVNPFAKLSELNTKPKN